MSGFHLQVTNPMAEHEILDLKNILKRHHQPMSSLYWAILVLFRVLFAPWTIFPSLMTTQR